MPFLTATWHSLSLLNFIVEPAMLKPRLPVGTELDSYHGDTYMSLVAFHWQNTRVLGLPIPFHRNFEELNLRFYARRNTDTGWKRGVVFVKELVPRRAVAAIARWVYSEPFAFARMHHTIEDSGDTRRSTFSAISATGSLSCTTVAPIPAAVPDEDSLERLLTDHQWGWTQRRGNCFEYEVQHPPWRVSHATSSSLTGDLAAIYGSELAAAMEHPTLALCCDGSPVRVMRGRGV